MKVKIISDGTAHGTNVVNVETGEPLEYVISVAWEVSVPQRVAHATIELLNIPVEIVADAEITYLTRDEV